MWNIFKMDLYRMMRSKYMWVIFLLILIFGWLGVRDTGYYVKQSIQAQYEEKVDMTSGEAIILDYKLANDIFEAGRPISKADAAAAPMWGRLLSIMAAIFYVLFMYREYSSGYIKNVAGRISYRGMLVLSKLAAMAVFTAFAMFCMTTINLLEAKNTFPYMAAGGIQEMLQVMAAHFILQMGNAAVILLLVTLSRSAILSMPIVLVLGSRMLYAMMGYRKDPGDPVMIYSLFGNIERVANGADQQAMIWACVVGLVYISVFAALSMIIMQKRDLPS